MHKQDLGVTKVFTGAIVRAYLVSPILRASANQVLSRCLSHSTLPGCQLVMEHRAEIAQQVSLSQILQDDSTSVPSVSCAPRCSSTFCLLSLACVQMVGPLLTRDAKPLPADLNDFLNKGSKYDVGAVYVSFGAMVRLSKPEIHSVSQALSALPNPVLWKLNPKHLPGSLRMSTRSAMSTASVQCTIST